MFLQLLISLPRINKPFLEGRAHWTADDAYFTLMAMHSLDPAVSDPWKVFGLTRYAYDESGRETGLQHYSHHPVLASTLYRAYAGAAGFEHWVPRSFALLFSMGITVLLFLLLRGVLGSVELSAALTFLYVVLPLNFNYQDAWKHEIVATFVVLLNYCLAMRLDGSRLRRIAFLAAFFLLFQAEWAVYAVGVGLWAYLFSTRPREDRRFLYGLLAVGVVSMLLNVWILYHLGFSGKVAQSQALYRMNKDMSALTLLGWMKSQWGFLGMNFSRTGMALLAVLVLGWCAGARRFLRTPLAALGGISLFSGLAWITVFRNLSFSHHYHQWYIGLGYVLLLAGTLEAFRSRWIDSRAWRLRIVLGLLFLMAVSAWESFRLEALIQEGNFAAPEDIAAVQDENSRLIVASDGASGPMQWWIRPPIWLYSDPHYKSLRTGIPRSEITGGVVLIEQLKKIDRRTDVVVTLREPQAVSSVAGRLRRFGVRRLALRRESPAFAFWALETAVPIR